MPSAGRKCDTDENRNHRTDLRSRGGRGVCRRGICPESGEALSVKLDGARQRVMEVAQHVGDNTVRCVMLSGSDGLDRGMQVLAPGKPIEVPGGRADPGQNVQRSGPAHRRRPNPSAEDAQRKQHLPQSPRLLRSRALPLRFWRPVSRSSTCWSPIPRAVKSVCSAAQAWARPY